MSLLAGLSVGGVLIGSGVLISQGESYQGHCVASGACGVLTAAMAARFFKTGEFMLKVRYAYGCDGKTKIVRR